MFELSIPGSLFQEIDRLQRSLGQAFAPLSGASSIRAVARAFPALNIGSTPDAVEVYAFAPGIDPARLEVVVDRGLLTLSGERPAGLPEDGGKTSVYANERFAGSFKRVISLPEDADPAKVSARYRDGVLQITIGRRESAQPRRITVQ